MKRRKNIKKTNNNASESDESASCLRFVELTQFDIQKASVLNKSAIEVLGHICLAVSRATLQSLDAIDSPDEVDFLINQFEYRAARLDALSDSWPRALRESTEREYEATKVAILLLSSRGPLDVDNIQRRELDPLLASRFLADCEVWVCASQTFAALSFAKKKMERILSQDMFYLQFEGKKLSKADFLLDIVELTPEPSLEHIPDMSKFNKGLAGFETDEQLRDNQLLSTILTTVYGIQLYSLEAIFLQGEPVQKFNIDNLSEKIRQSHVEAQTPELTSCASFVKQASNKWLDSAKKHTSDSFRGLKSNNINECWLKTSPRALPLIPATRENKQLFILTKHTIPNSAMAVAFDTIRKGDTLDKRRQSFLGACSTQLAWHQLSFAKFEIPKSTNRVNNDSFFCYVEERKNIAGVDIPESDLGDFDLVVFDKVRKVVTLCECKYACDVSFSTEFMNEFDKFDKSGDYWKKHSARIKWVRNNLSEFQLNNWPDEEFEHWSVQGCILTNIVPKSLLAVYGALPGTHTVGSAGAYEFIFGDYQP